MRSVCLLASARRPSGVMTAAAMLALLVSSAASQLQFEEEHKRALPAALDGTLAVAMGDVDGDLDLDVVFGSGSSITGFPEVVRLHRNDGHGVFTEVTATQMPARRASVTALELGDVDGDGDLDLVLAKSPAGLYVNDGTGVFTEATSAQLPSSGSERNRAVALGDVDGDRDLDVVFGDFSGQDRLLLNDGTGTFTDATAQLPTLRSRTEGLVFGDVDADGDLDLVLGDWGKGIHLYVNDGSGTFTDATTARLPRGPTTPYTEVVVLGDVDGDRDLDLVVEGNPNQLYLNDGTGTFTTAVGHMPMGAGFGAAELGDVDGDGDLDLVCAFVSKLNEPSRRRLYLNDGSGTFTDATGASDRSDARLPGDIDFTRAMELGDVDGDHDLDIVFGDYYQQNELYLNDGIGTFVDASAGRLPKDGYRGFAAVLGDVDGDRDLDLLTGGHRNRLHANDGRGKFAEVTSRRLPPDHDTTFCMELADFDGDGDLDLVCGKSATNEGAQDRLYLNDGLGTFTDVTASHLPVDHDATADVASGDVDADGDLDLVFANAGSSSSPTGEQNRLYLNDGHGRFADATATRLPPDSDITAAVVLADIDGDGDLDLVFANGNHSGSGIGGQDRLYLNDGTGTFTDATLRLPVDADLASRVVAADVDGDGDLDLAIANSRGQSLVPPAGNRLYLNDGTGTFTDVTATNFSSPNKYGGDLVASDVDLDGDLDLLFGAVSASALYLNDGTGRFTDVTAPRMPPQRYPSDVMVMGDVDADGDDDLMTGSSESHLYTNLRYQLAAPYLLRTGQRYQLDVYARFGSHPHGSLAFPFLSPVAAHIPVPPFGILGIDPRVSVALPPVVVPSSSGMGSVAFQVIDDPSLVGTAIHAQALIEEPTGSRLTNVTRDVTWR